MNEQSRGSGGGPRLQSFISVWASLASFWVILLFWNYFDFEKLELVPRFIWGATASWFVFITAEVIGMIIMTMMKEQWQAEARSEARFEMLEEILQEVREEARVGRMEAREARAREERTQETLIALLQRLERMGGERTGAG